MIVWHVVCVQCSVCLRQSHAAHELHSYIVNCLGHSSGRLVAVFVLRLNMPNVFALIPQFSVLSSNKERALYDNNFFVPEIHSRVTVGHSFAKGALWDYFWKMGLFLSLILYNRTVQGDSTIFADPPDRIISNTILPNACVIVYS